jgi:hypothetical protein
MESNNPEDEDDNEDETEYDEDDEDTPITPRKKRVSGLVRLTGKPKTPQKSTPKRSRVTKGKTTKPNIIKIPASDNDTTPKPLTKLKPYGRRKSKESTNGEIKIRSQRTNDTESGMMIPDSAGEAKDVWIISSDDE